MAFYYPRRLGTRPLRSAQKEDRPEKKSAPRRYEVWREGVALVWTEYEESPEDQVLTDLHSAPANKFTLILGEPGAGKTSLLENWFVQSASRVATQPQLGMVLPALIHLRSVPQATWKIDNEDAFADELWNIAINAKALIDGPHAEAAKDLYSGPGRFFQPLWFFDGLDELPNEIADRLFYRKLVNLPGRKVISCRTAVYQTLRDVVDAFRAREYEVMGLEPEEQLPFLQHAIAAINGESPETNLRAQQLFDEIQRNLSVRLLAGNTLMLNLMAEVAAGEEQDTELPISRAKFYEKAVDRLWYRKLRERGNLLRLRKERDQFLTQKAVEFGLAKLHGDLDADSALEEALRASGLIRFYEEDGRFEFLHLTFQEYYLARSLARTELKPVLEQYWSDARYEETLGLLISLLFQEGQIHKIEEAVLSLIEWGRETHRKDPQTLWRLGRSPLRTVLHILSRSSIHLQQLQTSLLAFLNQTTAFCRQAIAADNTTPSDVLASLAADENADIRSTVAGNQSTPMEVMARLAKDKESSVRETVAASASSPSVLMLLASDESAAVRLALTQNFDIPEEVLEHLTGDENIDIRQSVAEAFNAPAGILIRLAGDKDSTVRKTIAENTIAPQVLAKLDGDESLDVRLALAANGSTPPDVLARLATDDDIEVRTSAQKTRTRIESQTLGASLKELRLTAKNPATPIEMLESLATHEQSQVRQNVARNPAAPLDLLTRLASDPEPRVRSGAAMNSHTPIALLLQLANDGDRVVRLRLAANEHATPDILMRLADDRDNAVRGKVADNVNTPAELLARLADDEDSDVRHSLATRENASAELLTRLAGDESSDVRIAVAENPNTPVDVLTRLARDEDDDVRQIVVDTPSLPVELLASLASDENSDIRATVAGSTTASPELLAKLTNDESDYVRWNVARNESVLLEDLF
jgi:hypothetical protein